MFVQQKRKTKESKSNKSERILSAKRIDVLAEKNNARNESATERNNTEISDDNFNSKVNNSLSRDISIEGQMSIDAQIEQGIMNLLEQEIARTDKKQYPPRPQSLSFYEDELAAEDELSGQLQALSPAEKHAVINRAKNNVMTINANMEINDRHIGEPRDLQNETGGPRDRNRTTKHSKKTRVSDESLCGSREQIFGDQKKNRKHRKGKKDGEQVGTSSGSKRSRSHKNSFFNEGYQPRTEIIMALEDLQDDVFEGPVPIHGYNYGDSPKSPQYGDISPPLDIPTKVYVKNQDKFEPKMRENVTYPTGQCMNQGYIEPECMLNYPELLPLDVAIFIQKIWLPMATFCHGLLAGLALMHILLVTTLTPSKDPIFVKEYIELSEYYKTIFFVLCVICMISVFDRYDLAHLDVRHLYDLWQYRKSFFVVFVYMATLIFFLCTSDNAGYYHIIGKNTIRIAEHDGIIVISMWTSAGAILGWFILSCSSFEDLLCIHLENMSKFTVSKSPCIKNLCNN